MLELTGEKLATYCDVETHYNSKIAAKFIKAMDLIAEDMSLVEIVAVGMLINRATLGQYFDIAHPDTYSAPVDSRNLGYYLEQCMASLSQQYVSKKTEDKPLILL